MNTYARVAVFVVCTGAGCRSSDPNAAPQTASPTATATTTAAAIATATVSAPPPASAGPAAPDTAPEDTGPLAKKLASFREKLPPPATLSEQNGASLSCPHHGYVTYTLLQATAEKLPIASKTDLVTLARFARDEDACIRYIALEASMKKIGYDSNRIALPSVHTPDHYQYRDVLGSLKSHLDSHRVTYAPRVFAGLMLEVTERDFDSLMRGHWHEDVGKSKNFQALVELDGKLLRVTSHRVEPDPTWPDHTNTIEVDKVTLNADKQLVVTGAWRQESSTKGYVGKKITPGDITYAFWPVSRDVVWFREGTGYWNKLLRGKG